jgi:hypothetical protein
MKNEREYYAPSAPPLPNNYSIIELPIAESIPLESINEIASTDVYSSEYCNCCGLNWNEHRDVWEFKTELIKKNMRATNLIDSVKFKKRDKIQYENKLKVLKSEIDGLNATNDVYFKLAAKTKEISFKKLEIKKLEIDHFFDELNIEELEKNIDDFVIYQNAGMNLLKTHSLTFLKLDEILNEDSYVQYLKRLMEEYKSSCEKILQCENSLKSPFNFFNKTANEENYHKSKLENNKKQKIIEILLCKIKKTKYYFNEILHLHRNLIKACDNGSMLSLTGTNSSRTFIPPLPIWIGSSVAFMSLTNGR